MRNPFAVRWGWEQYQSQLVDLARMALEMAEDVNRLASQECHQSLRNLFALEARLWREHAERLRCLAELLSKLVACDEVRRLLRLSTWTQAEVSTKPKEMADKYRELALYWEEKGCSLASQILQDLNR